MDSTEQKKSAQKAHETHDSKIQVGVVDRPKHRVLIRVKSLLSKLPGAMKRHKKRSLVIAILLLVALGGIAALYLKNKNTVPPGSELTALNQALIDNDEHRALEYARKALAHSPDDIDTIFAAANVIKKYEPEEAKQLYGKALEIFKQQDNPDEEGKSAATYWAAASLAEDAGLYDQAKIYYERTITSADTEDGHEQYLMNSAQTALARLQK